MFKNRDAADKSILGDCSSLDDELNALEIRSQKNNEFVRFHPTAVLLSFELSLTRDNRVKTLRMWL